MNICKHCGTNPQDDTRTDESYLCTVCGTIHDEIMAIHTANGPGYHRPTDRLQALWRQSAARQDLNPKYHDTYLPGFRI